MNTGTSTNWVAVTIRYTILGIVTIFSTIFYTISILGTSTIFYTIRSLNTYTIWGIIFYTKTGTGFSTSTGTCFISLTMTGFSMISSTGVKCSMKNGICRSTTTSFYSTVLKGIIFYINTGSYLITYLKRGTWVWHATCTIFY